MNPVLQVLPCRLQLVAMINKSLPRESVFWIAISMACDGHGYGVLMWTGRFGMGRKVEIHWTHLIFKKKFVVVKNKALP